MYIKIKFERTRMHLILIMSRSFCKVHLLFQSCVIVMFWVTISGYWYLFFFFFRCAAMMVVGYLWPFSTECMYLVFLPLAMNALLMIHLCLIRISILFDKHSEMYS